MSVRGHQYRLEWREDDLSQCSVSASRSFGFEKIKIPSCSFKKLTELRGTVIVELKEGGIFRLELFSFRKLLGNDYSFKFHNISYELHIGARGALLLVPMA